MSFSTSQSNSQFFVSFVTVSEVFWGEVLENYIILSAIVILF